jgi:hypothetical protein
MIDYPAEEKAKSAFIYIISRIIFRFKKSLSAGGMYCYEIRAKESCQFVDTLFSLSA